VCSTVPPSPKGSGWVEAAPLQPPSGVEHVDRLVEAQSRADRAAVIRQQIENDWIEGLLDKKKSAQGEDRVRPLQPVQNGI